MNDSLGTEKFTLLWFQREEEEKNNNKITSVIRVVKSFQFLTSN